MHNITATIELLYKNNFSITINTSNEQEFTLFFEKACRDVANTQKDGEQIAECELNIIDEKNNKKCCILFDIVNYADYGMEILNILFYNSVDKKYKRFFIDTINENSCISGYEFIYFIQM